MEKRFQPDRAVRSSEDSVIKYRAKLDRLLRRARAQRRDTKAAVERERRRIAPELVTGPRESVYVQVLNQIESYRWVACDTMNYWIDLCPELLTEVIRRVDIVFINEDEIRQYTKSHNIFSGARKLIGLGARAAVIKRGEYGSVAVFDDDLFFAPAYPVEQVKDPTGAGDAFAGGFMSYLATQSDLSKLAMRKAVRLGTVMAALNVGDFSVEGLTDLDTNKIDTMIKELQEWS